MTDWSYLDTKDKNESSADDTTDKPDDSLPQARAGPQQLQQPQLLPQQDAQVNGAGQ